MSRLLQFWRNASDLPSLRILDMTGAGTSVWSEGQRVRIATESIELKVVTDSGRCVCVSTVLAPTATDTIASSMLPSRCRNAQKADPSVSSERRATLPALCSYVLRAGSTSVTSAKKLASWATVAVGLDNGFDASGGLDVVVAADEFEASFWLDTHTTAPTINTNKTQINVMTRRECRRAVIMVARYSPSVDPHSQSLWFNHAVVNFLRCSNDRSGTDTALSNSLGECRYGTRRGRHVRTFALTSLLRTNDDECVMVAKCCSP